MGHLRAKGTPPDIIAGMAKSVKGVFSQPAVATNLKETQQMTLLLADGKEFATFFAKQVSTWGQVVQRITSRRNPARQRRDITKGAVG